MRFRRVVGVRQFKYVYCAAAVHSRKPKYSRVVVHGGVAMVHAIQHGQLQFCSIGPRIELRCSRYLGHSPTETILRGALLNPLRMVGQQASQGIHNSTLPERLAANFDGAAAASSGVADGTLLADYAPALPLTGEGNDIIPTDDQSGHGNFCGFPASHVGTPFIKFAGASIEIKNLCEKGQLDSALDVLLLIDEEGTVPSVDMYRSLLKACIKRKALAQARRVHGHLLRHGLESVGFLADHVVHTMVKCGGLQDALKLFQSLPHRTVFSWTAMISGYTISCQGRQALGMYKLMKQEGVRPNAYTFISLLKACASLADLEEGKHIHREVLKHRCESDAFVGTCLVYMYGKCGSITDAKNVFYGLSEWNIVSCNVMLAACAQQGQADMVLQLYQQMWEEGVNADARTFVSMLQACGVLAEEEGVMNRQLTSSKSLEKGKVMHAHAQKKGHTSNTFVASALVSMYRKCGSIMDAQVLFDGLSHRDVVLWTAMLMAYVEQGQPDVALQLYAQMWEDGVSPDSWTFVSVLQACSILAKEEQHTDLDGHSTKIRSLALGKVLHANTRKKGITSQNFVANALLTMYAKCGSIADAQSVFDGLSQPDVLSWNAIISGYLEQGQAEEAFQLYEEMRKDGTSPDEQSFVSVLQACSILADQEVYAVVDDQPIKVQSLQRARAIHTDAWRKGYKSDAFIGSTLVSMYGKCGSVLDAQNTFDVLSWSSVVLWNVMLAVLVQQGQSEKALQLYEKMHGQGIGRDARTFVSALQACSMLAEKEEYSVVDGQYAKAKALSRGKAIHEDVQIRGCNLDVFVGSALVSMYGKCGSIVDAQSVFGTLTQHDVVLWNVMLAAYIEQGQAEKVLQLYGQMQLAGVSPNDRSFVSVLQACMMVAELEDDVMKDGQPIKAVSLRQGNAIHAHAISKGYGSDVFVGSTLVSMYGKCGSLVDAQNVFDSLSEQDVVSWTAIVAAYVLQGRAERALELYEEMHKKGVNPIGRTIVSALQACGVLAETTEVQSESKQKLLQIGKKIHSDARSCGLESDVFVGNTLVSMYSKCGSIVDAQKVFNGLSQRDLVSWNAILAACVQHGEADKALQLYDQVWEECVSPDGRTFVSALQACGMIAQKEFVVDGGSTKLKSLVKGKAIHDDVERKGYSSHVFVGNTLISMYGKCGAIGDAQNVFDGLSQRDVVSWTTLLASYVELAQVEKALQLYDQMQEAGLSPNDRTFVTALQACGMLAEQEDVVVDGCSSTPKSLEKGKAIHADLRRTGYHSDTFVGNTLVSMYGKCGSMEDAQDVFDGLFKRSVVSWNALLTGYAQQSQGEKVFQLYGQMQDEGISPDDVTIVSMLQVGSNTGSLDVCREMHQRLVACGKDLSPYVATTLIHAYGRCASMVDAQNVFDALLQPDVVAWNALIAGYARQGNCVASLQCYEEMRLVDLKADGVTFLSLLTACTHAGLVEKGVEYFESMSRDHGIAPRIEHYACMVDLFGRAGYFTKVQNLLSAMPMQPDLAMWLCLMGTCRKHGKVLLGRQAFDSALCMQPKHAAAYLLMSNIYADAGLWDGVRDVKLLRQKEGALKQPGQSWIQNQHSVHSFQVGDRSHPWQEQLYDLIQIVTSLLEEPENVEQ